MLSTFRIGGITKRKGVDQYPKFFFLKKDGETKTTRFLVLGANIGIKFDAESPFQGMIHDCKSLAA